MVSRCLRRWCEMRGHRVRLLGFGCTCFVSPVRPSKLSASMHNSHLPLKIQTEYIACHHPNCAVQTPRGCFSHDFNSFALGPAQMKQPRQATVETSAPSRPLVQTAPAPLTERQTKTTNRILWREAVKLNRDFKHSDRSKEYAWLLGDV
jgi:hypothetical protein